MDSLVIVVRNADENAEVGSTFEIEHEARIFDRLPGRLEEQPVLRIDVGSFARRDAKKLRIELIDAVNKAAAHGDGFAGHARLRIVISLHVPAIGRHLDDAFPAFDEKFPKGFLSSHAAGKTATDSDDCNTFFLHSRNWPADADFSAA